MFFLLLNCTNFGGAYNYTNAEGEEKSAIANQKNPQAVSATSIARGLYDVNGKSVSEINHSHPKSTMPSGYDKITGEIKFPLDGDAANAVNRPINSKGQPILRGVYRPAFQIINRYDAQKVYPGQAY